MSIYPVHLKSWMKNDPHHWQMAEGIIEYIKTCCVCNKPLDKDEVWAYHAVTYGYMIEAIWCSKECVGVEINVR